VIAVRASALLAAALTAVAILAAGGTALAREYFGSAPVTDRHTARCYSTVSRDVGPDFDGATVGAPHPSTGGDDVVAPLAACAEAWRLGVMTHVRPDRAHPPYPVPDLVGCVLPSGIAAVFPGSVHTCRHLGLPVVAQAG
jgi:hypothetical protein